MGKLTDKLIDDWDIAGIKFTRSHRGMVWINYDLRIACLGIPKCANSAIRHQFKLTTLIGIQEVPNDCFLFAVIRNPTDRFISAYIEVVQTCNHYPRGRFHDDLEILKEQIVFLDNLTHNYDDYERFTMYLNKIQHEWGFFELHCVPQIIYLTDENNKTFSNINKIVKLNNLTILETILGVKLIRHNQSENPDLKEKLQIFVAKNNNIKQQIEELYKYDLKLWQMLDKNGKH